MSEYLVGMLIICIFVSSEVNLNLRLCVAVFFPVCSSKYSYTHAQNAKKKRRKNSPCRLV